MREIVTAEWRICFVMADYKR